MRSSRQRDLILEIINCSHDHNTTQEIYQRARQIIPNISLGTVYRNLNQLVDLGLILRIKTSEGMDRFDNLNQQHHHFICDNCSRIIDVFKSFEINTKILPGSNVTHYAIQFHGICDKCLEEEKKDGIKRN